MPPDVGEGGTSSGMLKPMIRMKVEMIGQPHEIATGPPLFQAWPNVVKQPARIEMIENEIAKFEKPDHERLSSCLYPSLASSWSSAESPLASRVASDMGTPGLTGAFLGRLDPAGSGRLRLACKRFELSPLTGRGMRRETGARDRRPPPGARAPRGARARQPRRGGASSGPRPSRVRGLRGTARYGDPTGGLPARQHAAAGARA